MIQKEKRVQLATGGRAAQVGTPESNASAVASIMLIPLCLVRVVVRSLVSWVSTKSIAQAGKLDPEGQRMAVDYVGTARERIVSPYAP
jgi:hypothetical protein